MLLFLSRQRPGLDDVEGLLRIKDVDDLNRTLMLITPDDQLFPVADAPPGPPSNQRLRLLG